MTRTDDNETWAGELPPPTAAEVAEQSRYSRFRGEVVSGGSVGEEPAQVGGTTEGRIAGLVIVGLFVWLAFTNIWMFVFALGIVVSVFLHETGHFVTARLTGMKATQFFLGFGPRLWSFRRGETEYGVRALPLGAFVRIIGMHRVDEVPREDEARTYRQQTFPRRLLVISAGSLMHMLIAIALLFTVFAAKGEVVEQPGAEVSAFSEGGPAEQAGLQLEDVIVGIDGEPVESSADLGRIVRTHEPGETVAVQYERDGVAGTAEVTLGERTTLNEGEPEELLGTAILGVSSSTAADWQSMSLGDAAVSSVTELPRVAWESTKGVVKVLNPVSIFDHVTGESDDVTTRPTTVVGVTQVSGSIGDQEGIYGILYLLALLNVFVGVFNMFPLLPLDGGHAAIAVYERIREGRSRRRYFADVERLMPFALGVISVLLVLFMAGLYLDVAKPLG